MTGLSDEDWERVNAYHDNELSPKDAAAFEARLTTEPALAAALAGLTGVSRGLRALRPVTADAMAARRGAQTAPVRRITRHWLIGGALAASLLIVVAVGTGERGPAKLLDIHKAYVAQEFDVTQSMDHYVRSGATPEQPDLSGGNLTPVALNAFRGGTVAHYAGRNGCRLSYFRGQGTLSLPAEEQTQAAAWTSRDGVQHALIATGMDLHKFDAIAAFLHQTTKQLAIDHLYAAMTNATERAAPCVG